MDAAEYLNALEEAFRKAQDPERAEQMTAYMRGQYEYYGILAKPRTDMIRAHIRDQGLPVDPVEVIELCWERPQREWQYTGMELAERAHKKGLLKEPMTLFRFMIANKSWWDTVDYIASNSVGREMERTEHWRPFMEGWLNSGNLWLQRTTLLFQLKYKDRVDTDWLSYAIGSLKGDSEFFIQKAIGWALRQYARVQPDWVRNEVEKQCLTGLAKREALKHLNS